MQSIRLRCSSEDGPDVQLRCALGAAEARLTVEIDGVASEHVVPRARLAPLLDRLAAVRVPPAPAPGRLAVPAAYELTLAGNMVESTWRWVSGAPAGWEAIHESAQELLALAGQLTRPGAG